MLTEKSSTGEWVDAAGLVSRVLEVPADPTFVTAATQSRIDMAFLNPMAARLMKDVRVIPVPEGGIKLHKPLQVTLEFAGSRESAFATRKIRGLPAPVNIMAKEDVKHLEDEAFERLAPAVFEAWDKGSADDLWEKWCQLAESFLVEKSAIEANNLEIIGDKRYYGRGRAADAIRSRVSRNLTTDDGIRVDSERQELQRLSECTRELLRLFGGQFIRSCEETLGKGQAVGRAGTSQSAFSPSLES